MDSGGAAYLDRVSYHAVVRYLQRVHPTPSFVLRGTFSAQRWAEHTCALAGTTVSAVRRAILTPEIVAALDDPSWTGDISIRAPAFVVRLRRTSNGHAIVTTILSPHAMALAGAAR